MHERGVVADIVREAERICATERGRPVAIRLTIGSLSGLSPHAVGHYFTQIVGTDSPLHGARLDISSSDDLDPVKALSLCIDTLEFEED